jgi:SAM-dependent methyltransferase
MASLASHLPKPVRRRLGGIKRSLLGNGNGGVPRGPRDAARTATHQSRLQIRRDFVFRTADRAGTALEIGPAHNAILPKREGFHTKTVDYMDRDGLVEKYREFKQYSPDDIEDVDYVIPAGASMSRVIHERFDLVLASHVLEHSTSLIDFLNDCTDLLAPNGVLSLVVPDHRYCFDRFRERSSIGRVIDTSINPPPVHTVGTMTEFSLNAVKHRGTTSWSAGHPGRYRFVHDLGAVTANAARADGDSYIDVHNWVFSPNHLRLMLQDLQALGLITVCEADFQDTIGHEFFLNLTVDGPGTGLTREALVVRADAEQTTMDVPVFEPMLVTSPGSTDPAAGGARTIDPLERDE